MTLLMLLAILLREGNGTPIQYSCLENPMDRRVWWASVHGVTKSQTRLRDFTFTFSLTCIAEGNGNPLQCSCLENPRGRRAWWADIYGVAQSWTPLKRLSSSSNSSYVLVFGLFYKIVISCITKCVTKPLIKMMTRQLEHIYLFKSYTCIYLFMNSRL